MECLRVACRVVSKWHIPSHGRDSKCGDFHRMRRSLLPPSLPSLHYLGSSHLESAPSPIPSTEYIYMDEPMYHEYRVHQAGLLSHSPFPSSPLRLPPISSIQLVQETIETVMENASSSLDSDDENASLRDEFKSELSDKGDSDEDPHLDESHLARAHWIQLQKTNKQGLLVQSAFIHLMSEHKHTRPIWQFGRHIEDKNKHWQKKIHEDFYFRRVEGGGEGERRRSCRHHCASVQAAFTMIMENKDDISALSRLLHEVGAHHFFYDAYEPHLELFEDAFISTMKKVLTGVDELDDDTEKSWRNLFSLTKRYIVEGIAIQRASYLKYAVTAAEHDEIRDVWKQIVDYGLDEAGIRLCRTAFDTYVSLLGSFHLSLPVPLQPGSNDVFKRYSETIMMALQITVENYHPSEGFASLPEKLTEYTITCMILDVCPSLVRKAFMEGIIDMLQDVVKRSPLPEAERQMWCKIYRVLEQSILINIADY